MSSSTRTHSGSEVGAAVGAAVPVARILVAGVGNIFLRDDGFGPEVARYLASDSTGLHTGVQIVDYGIRGMHLAYDLLDGVDALILVDAIPATAPTELGSTGNGPGTIRVLQVGSENLTNAAATPALDPHGMDPMTVLNRLRALGGELPLTYVVGCIPADIDEGIGLSDAVTRAIPEAAANIRTLITEHIPSGLSGGEQ
ncbi:hydrogenase maturation protease [Arthrobacter sp. H14]|uniref:hydrogenase maturation protease n=1 Tax=Arthrobacter sp. H14 TaxID=1312959 RepID=UPI0009E08CDF|nr:hydrogenase maturation protease [Arthrobacter sp. H14]